MKIPVLSFFSGGGLLDLGFEEAGFDIAWTNENDYASASMYEYGMTSWRRSRGDAVHPASISSRCDVRGLGAGTILEQAFGGDIPPFFGIIGGPPCTDFSIGGHGRGSDGEYGKLLAVFAKLIGQIRPGFFLMENVSGLWRIQRHRQFLLSAIDSLRVNYLVDMNILNALEYGVPQDRERLFIVGFDRNLLGGQAITDSQNGQWRFAWSEPRYPGAKQLPWPQMVEFGSPVERPPRIPLELTVYPSLTGPPKPGDLPNGDEVFNAYSRRFWQVQEGDNSRKSFKRLHRYRYSPTAWYGNNEVHLHPWEPRRLTVREALRIQSAPDSYVLPSAPSLTAKFKLICNAVPCLLAKAIAESIRDYSSRVDSGVSAAVRETNEPIFRSG